MFAPRYGHLVPSFFLSFFLSLSSQLKTGTENEENAVAPGRISSNCVMYLRMVRLTNNFSRENLRLVWTLPFGEVTKARKSWKKKCGLVSGYGPGKDEALGLIQVSRLSYLVFGVCHV